MADFPTPELPNTTILKSLVIESRKKQMKNAKKQKSLSANLINHLLRNQQTINPTESLLH